MIATEIKSTTELVMINAVSTSIQLVASSMKKLLLTVTLNFVCVDEPAIDFFQNTFVTLKDNESDLVSLVI